MQCSNHGQRAGNNLCLECGKWYCSECMAAIMPKPICKNCAGQNRLGTSPDGTKPFAIEELNLPALSTKTLVRSGLAVSNILLGALSIFLHVRYGVWFFYIPFGATLLAHLPLNYLFRKPAKKGGAKSSAISQAQLDTLFRLADGKVSARRLASATGTDLKTAEGFLNKLVLENKLSVSTNDTEMIYTKADPLLLK